jgi:hypothetical protein
MAATGGGKFQEILREKGDEVAIRVVEGEPISNLFLYELYLDLPKIRRNWVTRL